MSKPYTINVIIDKKKYPSDSFKADNINKAREILWSFAEGLYEAFNKQKINSFHLWLIDDFDGNCIGESYME